MSGVRFNQPRGILRKGWSATVGDYAISGGWALRGKMLMVVDAAGGVFGFEGNSGKIKWQASNTHGLGLLSMDVHPSGAFFATGGQDGRVLIWQASDGQISQTIELGKGWVEHLAWSPDGQWLAVSISRRVHVYHIDGHQAWQSEDHPSTVSALAWSGKDELASACYGRVTFFGSSQGDVRQKLEWRGSLVSMVLSADGDIVACGSQDNTVHFWRRSTGNDSMMSGYPGKPSSLAFDSTGTLLATGGSDAVTVWSFEDGGPEGTEPGVLTIHVQPITALSFAPQGFKLASGGRDGGVAVWSLNSDGKGGLVGADLVRDIVADLFWRPDGRSLAALDATGGVTVWRVGK